MLGEASDNMLDFIEILHGDMDRRLSPKAECAAGTPAQGFTQSCVGIVVGPTQYV